MVCKVDGCDQTARSHGMCIKHWRRTQRGQPLDGPIRRPKKPCAEDGCHRDAVSRGLCSPHYKRMRKLNGEVSNQDSPVVLKECAIGGCLGSSEVMGLCAHHYGRLSGFCDASCRIDVGR